MTTTLAFTWNGTRSSTLLIIDDMLLASKSMKAVKELKAALAKEFEMKHLGPAL